MQDKNYTRQKLYKTKIIRDRNETRQKENKKKRKQDKKENKTKIKQDKMEKEIKRKSGNCGRRRCICTTNQNPKPSGKTESSNPHTKSKP